MKSDHSPRRQSISHEADLYTHTHTHGQHNIITHNHVPQRTATRVTHRTLWFYGNTDRRYRRTFSLRRMIWSILSSLCKSSVSSVLFRALYPSGQHFNSFNCAILFFKVRNSPNHKVRTAVTSHSHRNVSARMERLHPAIQREHFR